MFGKLAATEFANSSSVRNKTASPPASPLLPGVARKKPQRKPAPKLERLLKQTKGAGSCSRLGCSAMRPVTAAQPIIPTKPPPQLPVPPAPYDVLMRGAPRLPPPAKRPLHITPPRVVYSESEEKLMLVGEDEILSFPALPLSSSGAGNSGGGNRQAAEGAVRSLLNRNSAVDGADSIQVGRIRSGRHDEEVAEPPDGTPDSSKFGAASSRLGDSSRRHSLQVVSAHSLNDDPSSSPSLSAIERNKRRGSSLCFSSDAAAQLDLEASGAVSRARSVRIDPEQAVIERQEIAAFDGAYEPGSPGGNSAHAVGSDAQPEQVARVVTEGGSDAIKFRLSKNKGKRQQSLIRTFKRSLTDRMKYLENRHTIRMQHAREKKDEDLKRRQFNQLPKEEADAMQQVFEQFDKDESGFLEAAELSLCLKELGLRGTNTAEKREIMRILEEETGQAEHQKSDEDDIGNHVAVDLLCFALQVVPRVRQRLTELSSDEMLRQFYQYDRDGSGRLDPEHCLEIARNMGLDQRMMRKVIEDVHGAKKDGIDFEEFQDMVVKGREHVERVVREKERSIKDTTGISDNTFQEFRQDIVSLFDLFERHQKQISPAGGHRKQVLGQDEIKAALGEFGLLPKCVIERKEVDAILKSADSDRDGEFNFEEFLNLASQVRNLRQEKKRAGQLACFERYDKDRNGKLTVEEISGLLCDLGCIPQTRKEQEELASLIQVVDADGSGFIDFEEFLILSQRIDERLKSMRYEEEMEYALTLGFTESHLRDLRMVFDSLDADGSNKLDSHEVRNGLTMMRKTVSQDAFEAAFKALDVDGSGELDFLEFLDFMRLMRDGEGIFSEDTQHFATRVKFLEMRVIRRVLEYFGLSKSYVSSLSTDELVELFCGFFDINVNDNLHEKLNVSSVGELFEAAKKKSGKLAHDEPRKRVGS